MMKRRVALFVLAGMVFAGAGAYGDQAGDDGHKTSLRQAQAVTVLPERIDGVAPKDLVKSSLKRQTGAAFERWAKTYETLTTPEAVAVYQARLRAKFLEAIGGLPERTPLNPQAMGILSRDGYRVEKIIFESRPKFFVTAALFLPDASRHKPPYPGILIPCGHADNAKAYESYQTMAASLALAGMAALVFDPIDQGERSQLLEAAGKPLLGSTTAHTMAGVGAILLGRNVAQFEVWDGVRALDYLLSRPEVDPARVGITGNSGGGTQSTYLMALDERIKVAAPSCYLTGFKALLATIGPQDGEQNIFGQLAFGMDHADYILMRAPAPYLICAATKDFFDIGGTWELFRYAKRLYTRLGFAERVELMENDATHNYNTLQRQSILRWMARWLLGKDEPLVEPPIATFTDAELQATPRGQVVLLPGARTTYDLNADLARELAGKRAPLWAGANDEGRRAKVRTVTGIRPLAEIPEPALEDRGEGRLILTREDGVPLPVLVFKAEAAAQSGVVLYVDERGKSAAVADDAVNAGSRALWAVDLRGTGETQQTDKPYAPGFGPNLNECQTAYLLGRSFLAMRAEDILVSARAAAARTLAHAVDLIAVGDVGVPALHAAALEPQLFSSVRIVRSLKAWASVIDCRTHENQLVNAVHGALAVYDLPDLAAMLGRKLKVEESLDARGTRL